jgi:hypothetical protein
MEQVDEPYRCRVPTVSGMGPSQPGPPSGPAGPHVAPGVPVTRQQVHRAADAEVLITARARTGPHRFRCAARWPSGHRTAVGGRHSPLLVAESIRQACLCLAQGYFDVPGDTQFVIKSLAFTIDPGREPAARGAATDLVMDVDVGDLRHDPATGQLVALTMQGAYRTADDAEVFATAAGTARLFTPEQYTAVRAAPTDLQPMAAAGPLRRPAPGQVAVARSADVVIAQAPDERWLIAPADPRHPFFFDHPADHLPGMLLLEAARQHALLQLADPRLRLTGMRMRPLAFTEHQPPACLRTTAPRPGTPHPFRIEQGSTCVLEGTFDFAAAPSEGVKNASARRIAGT